MNILEDSNESVFSTISNGRRTDWEPNNNFLPLKETDEIKRILKEIKLNSPVMPSDNKPTTRWPPFDWHPETRFTMGTEPLNKWVDYDKQLKIERDLFKPKESYNFNHFETGIKIPERDTRFDNFDFKPYMPTPPPPRHTGALAFRAFSGIVMGVLALILLAKACGRKDRTRRGVVLAPGTVVVAGPVQQDIQTDRSRTGQGHFPPQFASCQPSGSDPPNIDLPPSYSECINKNVSEPPPPPRYTNPTDTEPLLHSGLVEIGFRNDCVAMTTTPDDSEDVKTELVLDNGRIVERLGLDLIKETGQGTHEGTTHSDVKDGVVYVNETSTPTRR